MAALRIRVVCLDRPAVALLDHPRCGAGDSFKFERSNQPTPKIGGLSQFVADDLKGWLSPLLPQRSYSSAPSNFSLRHQAPCILAGYLMPLAIAGEIASKVAAKRSARTLFGVITYFSTFVRRNRQPDNQPSVNCTDPPPLASHVSSSSIAIRADHACDEAIGHRGQVKEGQTSKRQP